MPAPPPSRLAVVESAPASPTLEESGAVLSDGRRLDGVGVPVVAGVWLAPLAPVAVAGLVAAAWLGPEEHRTELLTAAALLGAGVGALRQGPAVGRGNQAATATPPSASRLTDDELRAAIAAW